MYVCKNNREYPSTTKVRKNTACSYSIFTECVFDCRKIDYDHYRGKNCMKKFCKVSKK